MVNARHRARKRSASRSSQKTVTRAADAAATRRAAIFRNGGDAIVLSPVRRDWASFFELDTAVSEDFLAPRGDSAPQSREPL